MFEKKAEIGILTRNLKVILDLPILSKKESHVQQYKHLLHNHNILAECTTPTISNVWYCCLSIKTMIRVFFLLL